MCCRSRTYLDREKAFFLGLGRELITGDNTDTAELFTGSVFARDAKERTGPCGYLHDKFGTREVLVAHTGPSRVLSCAHIDANEATHDGTTEVADKYVVCLDDTYMQCDR